MARSRGGRRAPPPDLLPGIFAEGPEATTRPEAPAKSREATHPEASPDIVAELRRIGTQLEALKKQNGELSGGVERSAKAAAGAEEAIRELRSRVDAAAQGTTQAHDNLSARLAKIEAVVGELQTLPQSAKDVAHRLEVTEKGLVGVSETIGGAERRLSDRLKPIESASASVRGTTDTLAATATSLNAAAQRNARVLPTVTEVQSEVKKLRRAAYWGWAVVSSLVIILFLIVADYVIGPIGGWLTNLKVLVLR